MEVADVYVQAVAEGVAMASVDAGDVIPTAAGLGLVGLGGRSGQGAVFPDDRIVALEHSLAALQHQLCTLASLAGPMGKDGQDGYVGRDRIDSVDVHTTMEAALQT